MDHLAQHHEAAKLLAAASRQLSDGVRALRNHYRRRPMAPSAKPATQQLLNLIHAALQLAAAAQQVSETFREQSRRARTPAKPTRKAAPAAKRSKAARQPARKPARRRTV